MLTITAIIRTKPGSEKTMRDALLGVAENVRANELDTLGFFVSQDASHPCVFPPTSGSPIRRPWTGTTIRRPWRGSSRSPNRSSTVTSRW